MTVIGRTALILGLLAGFMPWPMSAQAKDPASLRGWISIRHPGVDWVSTSELASWLATTEAERPLLLDSRKVEEYGVSHLQDATRVEPDSDAPLPPDVPLDTLVVVYCSIGYRSAAIVRRLKAAGFSRVYNLQGGIFQWANEQRPVFREGEAVHAVHPYSRTWGRFLDEELRAKE